LRTAGPSYCEPKLFSQGFRVNSLSVNSANPIGFSYDADGLLVQAGALTLARDLQNGRLTGTTLNGVSDAWTYDGFGDAATYTASAGSTTLYALSFTRDNDPESGRWTSKDPIVFRGGSANLLAYVGNNPISRFDPYGLAWYDGIVALSGFGGPGTFSAAWSGFGSSWSDSANSIGQALGGSLAGNWDQVANAYDSGIFGQTQDADPFTYYGTRAAVGTAAAATAAAVAIDAAGISTRIACHGSHHEFGPLGRLRHVQLNWWQAGVKGSGGALRIPVPPGTPGFPP
jgi:RHS repeat-associated protein